MGTFTKTIKTEAGDSLEFLFTSMHTPTGRKCYIVVTDTYLIKHKFWMEINKGFWRVAPEQKLPLWILELEKKFEVAILDKF